jgi:hypothetical protein
MVTQKGEEKTHFYFMEKQIHTVFVDQMLFHVDDIGRVGWLRRRLGG